MLWKKCRGEQRKVGAHRRSLEHEIELTSPRRQDLIKGLNFHEGEDRD